MSCTTIAAGKRGIAHPARTRLPDHCHIQIGARQPEIAQGTLQMLFEFQTQVARLFGCDVANASMYDGSTACWEAIGMAGRVTKREKAVLSAGLHPHYVSVAKTMAHFTGDTLDTALPALDGIAVRLDA